MNMMALLHVLAIGALVAGWALAWHYRRCYLYLMDAMMSLDGLYERVKDFPPE